MARSHTPTPNALFRTATLLGCVALLLGVAGIFYFGVRERTLRAGRPADRATVVVHGVDDLESLVVVAHWPSSDGSSAESEEGTPGAEQGHWTFRAAPEGQPLTLWIYRTRSGERVLLGRQPAILTRGALFEAYVRPR